MSSDMSRAAHWDFLGQSLYDLPAQDQEYRSADIPMSAPPPRGRHPAWDAVPSAVMWKSFNASFDDSSHHLVGPSSAAYDNDPTRHRAGIPSTDTNTPSGSASSDSPPRERASAAVLAATGAHATMSTPPFLPAQGIAPFSARGVGGGGSDKAGGQRYGGTGVAEANSTDREWLASAAASALGASLPERGGAIAAAPAAAQAAATTRQQLGQVFEVPATRAEPQLSYSRSQSMGFSREPQSNMDFHLQSSASLPSPRRYDANLWDPTQHEVDSFPARQFSTGSPSQAMVPNDFVANNSSPQTLFSRRDSTEFTGAHTGYPIPLSPSHSQSNLNSAGVPGLSRAPLQQMVSTSTVSYEGEEPVARPSPSSPPAGPAIRPSPPGDVFSDQQTSPLSRPRSGVHDASGAEALLESLEMSRLDLGTSVSSTDAIPNTLYPPNQHSDPRAQSSIASSGTLENQHTSRSIVVRNVAPGVDDEVLRRHLETFGPLRELGAQQRSRGGRGSVTATYFDLRHARQAVKHLNGQTLRGRPLDVRFCTAAEESSLLSSHTDRSGGVSEYNQGTLVVFNVDITTKAEDIRRIFGAHGSVKEIRETPHKRHHKFVEFYDVRDAERAMRTLNKTELNGKKIKIEISRPGGNRSVNVSPPLRPVTTSPREDRDQHKLRASAFPPLEQVVTAGGGRAPSSSPPMHNKQSDMEPAGDGIHPLRLPAAAVTPTCANPKYVLDITKVKSGEDSRTALMVRNIPNKYNQRMLLSTLEENHHGELDFFYLPIDFKNKCNVGYCFINFVKPECIAGFYEEFHGKKWGKFNSEKVCEINYARIQGKANLIAHFQNSSLMNEDPKCRPVIFGEDGEQKEFPVGPHVRTRRGPSARESKASEQALI